MQALPLAQHLDLKPQTGHLSGIEAASVPAAPVPTATAASTLIASGQTTDISTGMSTHSPLKPVPMKCDVNKERMLRSLSR